MEVAQGKKIVQEQAKSWMNHPLYAYAMDSRKEYLSMH